METLHCPESGCDYASFAAKFCPAHGVTLVSGSLRTATNTVCPYCHAGGIFPNDNFCRTCGRQTFIFLPKIHDLGFTTRTENCLSSEDIGTLWALLQKTANELLEISRLGEKNLAEIKDKLDKLGFKLKG